MTWPEDGTMSEGKQRLQRDVTELDVSRRGAGRTCLMFVAVLRRDDEYIVMVKTGNECQFAAYVLSRSVPWNRTLHRLSAYSRDLLIP